MTTSFIAKLSAMFLLAIVPVCASGCAAEEGEEDEIEAEEQGSTTSALTPGCESGKACIYQHSNRNGRLLEFRDGGCQNFGPYGFNDKASSVWNRTNRTLRIYKDSNCRGSYRSYSPGARSNSLGNFSDEGSSIRIL